MYHQDSRTTIRESLQKEIQTPQFLRKFNRFKKSQPQITQINPLLCTASDGQVLNPRTDDRILHLIVSEYQKNPKRKSWLISLLLLTQWKKMEQTSYRFGFKRLNLINPHDPFAPVYAGYIDAFLSVKQNTSLKFCLHIKDRAEYLIRKELKECNRFKGELDSNIPAPEQLPWQFEIDQMIDEWVMQGVLTKEQGELVIYHTVYEYTFKELAKKQGVGWRTVQKQYQRAVKKLKPYLGKKHFGNTERILSPFEA